MKTKEQIIKRIEFLSLEQDSPSCTKEDFLKFQKEIDVLFWVLE